MTAIKALIIHTDAARSVIITPTTHKEYQEHPENTSNNSNKRQNLISGLTTEFNYRFTDGIKTLYLTGLFYC
jgi:hypothetical protein